jgi:hypothetical protein
LARFIHQGPGDFGLDTRQADVEASPEKVPAVRQVQVHFGVDGGVGRQNDLPFAGRKPDRTFETRRPAGGEQLLRIGADARRAGGRKLDVEVTVRAAGGTVFPPTGGTGLGRVPLFRFAAWRVLFPVGSPRTPDNFADVSGVFLAPAATSQHSPCGRGTSDRGASLG